MRYRRRFASSTAVSSSPVIYYLVVVASSLQNSLPAPDISDTSTATSPPDNYNFSPELPISTPILSSFPFQQYDADDSTDASSSVQFSILNVVFSCPVSPWPPPPNHDLHIYLYISLTYDLLSPDLSKFIYSQLQGGSERLCQE